MGTRVKDVILLVAIVALVVLALLPTDRDGETAPEPGLADVVEEEDASPDEERPKRQEMVKQATARAAPPLADVPHPLFPIVRGSRWEYQVSGPPHLVPDKTWSLMIVSAPSNGEPGVVEVGFGDAREERSLWLEDGAVRLDALPCVEPIEFLGNRPRAVSGAFLPASNSIVIGAVWSQEYQRRVVHKLRDDRGRLRERKASAVQRDRALAKEIHQVDVPAGRFDARRVEWTGRIAINVGRRAVFDGLTIEPFRAETTWFAAGLGMVRRRVTYGNSMRNSIVFNLVRYERQQASDGGQSDDASVGSGEGGEDGARDR